MTVQELFKGHRPTVEQMGEICTYFHEVMVEGDDPELLWLTPSFEDMADAVTKAIQCTESTT